MTTTFEKRIRMARGVLFVALALFVMAQFLPKLVFLDPQLPRWNGTKMTQGAVDYWVKVVEELGRMTMPLDRVEVILLAAIVMVVFVHGFIASAPWLVGVYSRSGALRWIARLIAGVYAGMYVIELVGIVHSGTHLVPGIGGGMECAGVVLLAVGLFLIPRRPRDLG